MARFLRKYSCWIALACLVVPMFASYYFDDMFSTLSHLFENPSALQLGWNSADYGLYTSGYSVLCVFGGLVVCGMLLDKWGVRITGSIFVTMMAGGAALVAYALTSGLPPKTSLTIAYIGCMFFGLGSEIAGVAVTRSIAKWFKDGNMAFAMGLQLAIARLGTAFALVISPKLVAEKGVGETYSLMETASPAFLGLILMLVGMVLWAIFVAMDARFDRQAGLKDTVETAEEDKFRFSDVVKLLKNKHFIVIALLCVFFYSSVVSFKKFASSILIPRFDVPVERQLDGFDASVRHGCLRSDFRIVGGQDRSRHPLDAHRCCACSHCPSDACFRTFRNSVLWLPQYGLSGLRLFLGSGGDVAIRA